MRALLVLMLALPGFVTAAGQRPVRDGADAGLRIVRGEVRSDDDSVAILRRARVTIAGSPATAVFTDREGRFEVAVPESATALLRISKPGFAPAQVGVPPALTDRLQIRLARGAAIVARVFDDFGLPAVAVDVRVRRVPESGERGRAPVDVTVATDDLGEFRVGSLPAGSYALSVETRRAADALPPTAVRLRAGEESEVVLFHQGAAEDARSAADYVSGYEAGQRAGPQGIARRVVFGTAFVTGRVTEPNGRGVAGAIVRLNPVSAGSTRLAATNVQGQFQFSGVPAGAYRVVAEKTGFISGEYGRERAAQPGRVVTLRDRQRLERVDIGMPRGAVVTGTVTDPDGEPMEGLAMHVWRERFWNGRRIAEAATAVAVRRTDDRGRYRLHGLQPGSYYVVAADDPTATSREVTGAPRSFYPGTPVIAEASTVHVDVGVDADAAHLVFNPAQAWRIAGGASDSEGHPLERPVVLAGSTRSGIATAPQIAMMGPGFEFAFEHVMPGSYVMHAIQRLELPDRVLQEFGTARIDVSDHNITELMVMTTKGASVSGRILVEGDRAPGGNAAFPFDVVSADPDFAPPPGQFRPWTVRINPDGTFLVDGLSGPVRFTSTTAPAGWFLKTVDIGGRNAAEEPVVFGTPNDWRGQVGVIFSSAGAEISGRAVNGRNEPVGTYVVAAFPTDRGRWYTGSRFIRTAVPDEEARFRVATLPPGDYWVAAVESLPAGSLEDPDLLGRLSTIARRVALSAGERLVTDLPLVTLGR